jgi:hypothetical protein
MFSRAGVQAPDAYTRPHDGEIKEAPPQGAKPLTWLGSLRGLRSVRVLLSRERCDFSGPIPALTETDAPMNSSHEDINVRLGRIRDRGGGKSFADPVQEAGRDGSYAAGRRR